MLESPDGPSHPAVTVVVPCRDDTYLHETIASLAAVAASRPFEVVVVDASDGGLAARVEPYADGLDVRVVEGRAGSTPGSNRNRGVRAALAPLVLFVDADDTVARGYVDAMAAALESHELVCASVDMETLNPWNPGGTHPQATGLVTAEMGFLPFAGAGTLGIHRSLFEAVGGFDPLLPCYEEADLCWRLQLAGHAPPAFVPQARLHYRLAEDRTRRWRKAMTFGRTQVLLYSRFRRAGMPRESVGRAAAAWVDLARSAAGRAGGRSGSGVGWHAAVRVGRLVGSIRHGVAYL